MRLATHYDRHPDLSIEDCRKFIAQQVEYINHSLRGIPADRVRFHTCYSVNIAPRVHDFELRHFADLMLKIKAQVYLIEAANVRHEHEAQLWADVSLPDGKMLAPGVVTHSTPLIEHPQLVCDRIVRWANLVGKENVIASTDCGLGLRLHPQLAWAKLRSLTQGAAMATDLLW